MAPSGSGWTHRRPASSTAGNSMRPRHEGSGFPKCSGLGRPTRVPSVSYVQWWNGQVKRRASPRSRSSTTTPRWRQAFTNARKRPSSSRVARTGVGRYSQVRNEPGSGRSPVKPTRWGCPRKNVCHSRSARSGSAYTFVGLRRNPPASTFIPASRRDISNLIWATCSARSTTPPGMSVAAGPLFPSVLLVWRVCQHRLRRLGPWPSHT